MFRSVLKRAAAQPKQLFHRARNISTGGFRPLQTYNRMLEQHPVLTKATTSTVLIGVGDVLCQLAFEGHGFDFGRLFRACLLGGLYVGPSLHVWYNFVNKLAPGVGAGPALRRLVLDQGLFAPCAVAIYVTLLLILEGRAEEVLPKLSADFWTMLRSNWVLWIPAQALNFRYVPLQHRVLFSNCVALLWNTYLSFATHHSMEDAHMLEGALGGVDEGHGEGEGAM